MHCNGLWINVISGLIDILLKHCIKMLLEQHWSRLQMYMNTMPDNYSHLIKRMRNIYTACVNKSASLKEHFFLRKLYVSFEKVYNNMKGNIISFYRIFVLCYLDVWLRNYGKSCKVPPNLFGLIHLYMYYRIHHWRQLEYQCWKQIIQNNTRTFWQK